MASFTPSRRTLLAIVAGAGYGLFLRFGMDAPASPRRVR